MQSFGFYQQVSAYLLWCTEVRLQGSIWRCGVPGAPLSSSSVGADQPLVPSASCVVQKITSGSPICWEKCGLVDGWIGGTETEKGWTMSA